MSLQECHSSLHIMHKCLHVNCYSTAKIDNLHKTYAQKRKFFFVELNQGRWMCYNHCTTEMSLQLCFCVGTESWGTLLKQSDDFLFQNLSSYGSESFIGVMVPPTSITYGLGLSDCKNFDIMIIFIKTSHIRLHNINTVWSKFTIHFTHPLTHHVSIIWLVTVKTLYLAPNWLA